MTIHRVRVQRQLEAEIFVEGDDLDMVREDAEELASALPADQWDSAFGDELDIDVVPEDAYGTITGRDIWSGGPDGHDFYLEEVDGRIVRSR